MSPEEAELALGRLRAALERHGLAWLVRDIDEEFEERVDAAALGDESSERLVLLIDASLDVIRLTEDLRRGTPDLLLRGTRAETAMLVRRGDPTDEDGIETPITTPEPQELIRIEELTGALSRLRELAVADV